MIWWGLLRYLRHPERMPEFLLVVLHMYRILMLNIIGLGAIIIGLSMVYYMFTYVTGYSLE